MTISITISADTPELLAERATWLATRLGSTVIAEQVIAGIRTKTDPLGMAIETPKTKAKKEPVAPAAAPSAPTESAAPEAEAAVSAGPEALALPEIQKLAALKAKKVGPSVVKGLVADTGFTQIADIDKPEILMALVKNLEAL